MQQNAADNDRNKKRAFIAAKFVGKMVLDVAVPGAGAVADVLDAAEAVEGAGQVADGLAMVDQSNKLGKMLGRAFTKK